MPSVSKKQHDAMEAAAHGDSKIGIPQSVGAEYVAADEGKKKRKPKTITEHLDEVSKK